MAAWQIMALSDASLADAFIAEGRVCLGFSVPISMTEFDSLAALKLWMNDNAPHEGPQGAKSMWRLLHEVQIGDWVVMPSKPRRREYAIGRITGHYSIDPALVEMGRDPHTRAVEWLKTGIPGERMASLRLPTRGTIVQLKANQLRGDGVEERIEAMLD